MSFNGHSFLSISVDFRPGMLYNYTIYTRKLYADNLQLHTFVHGAFYEYF